MQTVKQADPHKIAGDMNFVTCNVRTGYLVVQCSLASVLLLLLQHKSGYILVKGIPK